MCDLKLLSRDDIELVHDASLKVLEKDGIIVKNKVAFEILEKAGCKVDSQNVWLTSRASAKS